MPAGVREQSTPAVIVLESNTIKQYRRKELSISIEEGGRLVTFLRLGTPAVPRRLEPAGGV